MSRLLDQAFATVHRLPPDEQERIAHAVPRLAGWDEEPPLELSPAEEVAIATSRAAAARGEFASEEQLLALWVKHGL